MCKPYPVRSDCSESLDQTHRALTTVADELNGIVMKLTERSVIGRHGVEQSLTIYKARGRGKLFCQWDLARAPYVPGPESGI
jgi:hypothetical protein